MDREALRTLLYVDDEPDIREVVSLSLGVAGHWSVYTCESGVQALEALATLKPDLVLLDVMMPELDGPATLQRMRGDPTTRHIPVIFITAKAMPQEVARFMEIGAVSVIAKPFDPMQLPAQVLQIWEGLEPPPPHDSNA